MSNFKVGSVDKNIENESRKRISDYANDINNPWIPVAERLPDQSVIVMGKIDTDEIEGIPHEIILIDNTWHSANLGLPMEGCVCNKVTHWKPMPEEN